MSYLLFNKNSSTDFNMHISEPPEFSIPERDYETVHIPGRNGDLIIDSGKYNNTTGKYKVNIDASHENEDYFKICSAISAWLHPSPSEVSPYGDHDGYYILKDTYDPTHFRYAKYKGGSSISNIFNKAGEMDLEFECKPQRYLASGAVSQRMSTTSLTMNNPTKNASLPYIIANLKNVSDRATITIDYPDTSAEGIKIYIRKPSNVTYLLINSENETILPVTKNSDGSFKIYHQLGTYYAQSVEFYTDYGAYVASYDFPKLMPGRNVISVPNFSTYFNELYITPNWWDL